MYACIYINIVLLSKVWLKVFENYVEAVNRGAIPTISNAFESMAESENSKAVEEALKMYTDYMKNKGRNVRELSDVMKDHSLAEKKALNRFGKRVIGDYGGNAHEKMEVRLFLISYTVL